MINDTQIDMAPFPPLLFAYLRLSSLIFAYLRFKAVVDIPGDILGDILTILAAS
jgi:hypothetical protein